VSEAILPFERELYALQERLAQTRNDAERAALESELRSARESAYANLTAWQRLQVARHPNRPRMLDIVNRVFDDFIELHGDRAFGDDSAMVCGLARIHNRTVVVVGQHKGVSTEERVRRKFGMAHPEGYRKALRMFRLAERLRHPVVTFVDTPAAHPDIEAEQRGQGYAIAQNLLACSRRRC